MKLPAREHVKSIDYGWRDLQNGVWGEFGRIDEIDNALVIYDTFKEYGYSDAVAFAALVNARAESAFDNTAVMNEPFAYRGRYYPNGSSAIGLFQLLPSKFGAGGPTGPEEGYDRVFQDRKFAGNKWQARRYGDKPDARGRRYYDGTDPRINTERIILEVERDGTKLLEADRRGASIADLSYIFGRDIERPQKSSWYRRRLAAEMFGNDIAYTRHPNDVLFATEAEVQAVFAAGTRPEPAPEVRVSVPAPVASSPTPRRAGQPLFLALLLMAISGGASLLGRRE